VIRRIKKNKGIQQAVYYQYYIDMMANKKIYEHHEHSYVNFIIRSNMLISHIYYFHAFVYDRKTLVNFIDNLFKSGNIRIKVYGKHKLVRMPRIFIANHSHFFDAIVLYRLFNCSFVASKTLLTYSIGKRIAEILDLMIIDRGVKGTNMTDKIRNHVKNVNNVCIFPEGSIATQDIMLRFRTGAFYANYPIQPIVLVFDPYIYDENTVKFFYYFLSQPKVTVKVHILDIEYPPFTSERIEGIRKKMAKVGNMALSRVSTKDLKEGATEPKYTDIDFES